MIFGVFYLGFSIFSGVFLRFFHLFKGFPRVFLVFFFQVFLWFSAPSHVTF